MFSIQVGSDKCYNAGVSVDFQTYPDREKEQAMGLDLRELAKSPASLAFSKIRTLTGLTDLEGLTFFQGLFQSAVLSKEDGDWTRVENFLDQWETFLISRTQPQALTFDSTPWTPFRKPLREARVALISTGGIYLKPNQPPYNTEGDASFRPIPIDNATHMLGISHTRYDTSNALRDINVIFPYERLKEMELDGTIGSLANPGYGFMGYITGDLIGDLLNTSVPEVARRLVADKVDAVLIGTT